MKKIAILTDSNSGMTREEAKEYGVSVIPMPFLIDGETYYEGVDFSQADFYRKLKEDSEISTSQPSPENVTKEWDRLLSEADSVVYIPMSSGLSGSCQTARMLAEEYDGRVQVVNNQRISVTQKQSVLDAKELAERGKSAEEIKDYLEQVKFESSIYIMLDTLKYLKKGGRITPAAAALGSALRLKPVLQIQGEKLDKYMVARTGKQGAAKMIAAMESDMEKRFGGMDKLAQMHFAVAYTYNEEAAEEFAAQIKEKWGITELVVNPLSLSVSCHIGPGALAIACSKKIE
ncbi:MAG: DegV family protein [Lachnospiraceae bacterium]|nr:DegV family protein [Lachnospiraceae bacterium]